MTRFTKSRSMLFLLGAALTIVAPAEAREPPYKPHSAATCGIGGYRYMNNPYGSPEQQLCELVRSVHGRAARDAHPGADRARGFPMTAAVSRRSLNRWR